MPNRLEQLAYQIISIFGGWAPTYEASSEDQFLLSIGIDPEFKDTNFQRPLGAIVPMIYTEFSGAELTGAPMWVSGAQTSTGLFVYGLDGTVVSYAGGTLTGEVGIAGLSPNYGGAGNGMVVWNDYVYCATASTVARYGPLSASSPTFQFNYWVDSLGMSSLTNSDYPATRNVTYPNHVLVPHNDGRTYVLDYDGANGRLHSFTTDSDGTDGSATFSDVTFPPGMMPMAAASYGTDLAIVLSPQATFTSGVVPRAGNAVLALWDAVPGNRPYRYIPISEPLATAIKVKNGELFVFAGNIDTNVKVLKYLGGYSFQTVTELDEGTPPPAGAVDSEGEMLAWGGHVTVPGARAGVFTLGHRSGKLPNTALHNIGKISDSGTFPFVSCLKFIQRGKYPVIGWSSDSGKGLDKQSATGTVGALWRSRVFNVGRPFVVRRVVIPLADPVSSGVNIAPKLYLDNEEKTYSLTAITPTDYSSSERQIDYQGLTATGRDNFYLELDFQGTTVDPVLLPIRIEIEMTN